MSNERRTALQAAVAGLLGAAAAFGFITAEETQTYGVASASLLGAISSIVTAVNTWKQREIMADARAAEESATEDE